MKYLKLFEEYKVWKKKPENVVVQDKLLKIEIDESTRTALIKFLKDGTYFNTWPLNYASDYANKSNKIVESQIAELLSSTEESLPYSVDPLEKRELFTDNENRYVEVKLKKDTESYGNWASKQKEHPERGRYRMRKFGV
jgi:hypothetical protein